MIFLDFEQTIFNSDAYDEYVRGSGTSGDTVDELAQFVYPDAAAYLRGAENSAMIVSRGDPVIQKQKIQRALTGIPRLQILCVGDRMKGEFLAPYIEMYGVHPSFVDNSALELECLEKTCPTFRLIQMMRDGSAGDGRWQIIHNFSELH